MRTQEEIAKRIRGLMKKGEDPTGHRREVLIFRLDWGAAREFLPRGRFDPETWAQSPQKHMTVEEEAASALAVGVQAALAHDGRECVRVVTNLAEYAWLVHGDPALRSWEQQEWRQFGVPTMRWAGQMLSLPSWPIAASIQPIARMADGKPCMDGCRMGCSL